VAASAVDEAIASKPGATTTVALREENTNSGKINATKSGIVLTIEISCSSGL